MNAIEKIEFKLGHDNSKIETIKFANFPMDIQSFDEAFPLLFTDQAPIGYDFISSQPDFLVPLEAIIIQQLNQQTDLNVLRISCSAFLQIISHSTVDFRKDMGSKPEVLQAFLQNLLHIFQALTITNIPNSEMDKLLDYSIFGFISYFSKESDEIFDLFFQFYPTVLVPIFETNTTNTWKIKIMGEKIIMIILSKHLGVKDSPLNEPFLRLFSNIIPDNNINLLQFINSNDFKPVLFFFQHLSIFFFQEPIVAFLYENMIGFIHSILTVLSENFQQLFTQATPESTPFFANINSIF